MLIYIIGKIIIFLDCVSEQFKIMLCILLVVKLSV